MTGIALLVLGVVALVHCDERSNFGGFSFCVRNDWGAAGGLGLLLGIVLLIVGIVLPIATAPTPPEQAYAVPVAYVPVQGYAQAYYPQQAYGAAYVQPYAPAYPQPYGTAPPPPAPPAPAAAAPAQRTCTKCGAAVTSQFCASCGTQQW